MVKEFSGQYDFLSNFYTHSFSHIGVVYPTAEHAYQVAKTTNIYERKKIMKAETPEKAKKLGQLVTLRADWERMKYIVMSQILISKFQVPELQQKLLQTGTLYLEEGNYWHDNTWGNCGCKKCSKIKGKNWLGKALMETRAYYKVKTQYE